MSSFDELAPAVIEELVIERSVPLRDALELVVEVEDDLGERKLEEELDSPRDGVAEVRVLAALVEAELHHGAHVAVRHEDRRLDVRLEGVVDRDRVGIVLRVVDRDRLAALEDELVHRRSARS